MWRRCILGKLERFRSLVQGGGDGSSWAGGGSVPSDGSRVLLGDWCRTSCSLEGAHIHLALIDLLPGSSWRMKGFTGDMLATVPNPRFLVPLCSADFLPLPLPCRLCPQQILSPQKVLERSWVLTVRVPLFPMPVESQGFSEDTREVGLGLLSLTVMHILCTSHGKNLSPGHCYTGGLQMLPVWTDTSQRQLHTVCGGREVLMGGYLSLP